MCESLRIVFALEDLFSRTETNCYTTSQPQYSHPVIKELFCVIRVINFSVPVLYFVFLLSNLFFDRTLFGHFL